MTNTPLPLAYARRLTQKTAQLGANEQAVAPRRFMAPLPPKELEEAMNAAHKRLAQVFLDNWDYLDARLNPFFSWPPAQRLARYIAVATETIKAPDPMTGEMVATGQLKYGSFAGWIQTLASINALAADRYLKDAIQLQERLKAQEYR